VEEEALVPCVNHTMVMEVEEEEAEEAGEDSGGWMRSTVSGIRLSRRTPRDRPPVAPASAVGPATCARVRYRPSPRFSWGRWGRGRATFTTAFTTASRAGSGAGLGAGAGAGAGAAYGANSSHRIRTTPGRYRRDWSKPATAREVLSLLCRRLSTRRNPRRRRRFRKANRPSSKSRATGGAVQVEFS
jgi:hypothetical protein